MRWTSKVGFSGGDGNNLPKVDKLDVDLIWKVWVSEWVLLIAKSEIFQLCTGENTLIFNDMMSMSTLY
jgi:hypothetical protein